MNEHVIHKEHTTTRGDGRAEIEASEIVIAPFRDITPQQRALPATYDALLVVGNFCANLANELLLLTTDEMNTSADGRFALTEKKIAALQLENLELRTLIADLSHEVGRLKSTRGVTDGQALPASLLQPRAKPAAKRKREPPDVIAMPDRTIVK
jgi:hypothetical protein